MERHRSTVNAFVHALEKEAAESLIDRKMRETGFTTEGSYGIKEVEELVEALKKENILIRTLAMAFMAQMRIRGMQMR
jgi:hypothetical protein